MLLRDTMPGPRLFTLKNHAFLWVILSLFVCSNPALSQNQAVILQYHHVSTETPPVTSLSPEAFRTHMLFLQENAFTILPLEKVIKDLQDGNLLPDKTAVITFDDGYTSVYEAAFPLLKELNWPFTVFVTSELVGSNDRLYATWDQLREMGGEGATLANHTVSHPYLLERDNGIDDERWLTQVRQEIELAENTIAEQTGQNHKLLAYPYGEYNDAIQALVSELGYVGIAQHSGPINAASDFTALPRFPFSGIYASMNTFPTKVFSLAFSLDNFSPSSPVTSSPRPEAMLDFSTEQAGLSQLACFNNNERISVNLRNAENNTYQVSTHVENMTRRFRYNCTAPFGDGRFFWYSIPWVNPEISE